MVAMKFFLDLEKDKETLTTDKKTLKLDKEKLEEKRLEPKISIDERIDHIRKILSNKLRFSFSNFLKAAQSKTEIIVSFLAVLELAKQKELVFEQDELFSEIHIAWNDANINL